MHTSKQKTKKMKAVAVVLLSLLSLGHSAPLSSCDDLLKPITVSKEEMLGKWILTGSSSNIPGSRSLFYLLSSVWFNVTPNSQSNGIHIVRNEKILEECSSLAFDGILEESTLLIEKPPVYLKQIYLPTECSDCSVAKEDIRFGNKSFTSLVMLGKSRSVSSAAVEMLKKQAECLGLPSPIMLDPTSELCPESMTPKDGACALQSMMENKIGAKIGGVLDSIFDLFVN